MFSFGIPTHRIAQYLYIEYLGKKLPNSYRVCPLKSEKQPRALKHTMYEAHFLPCETVGTLYNFEENHSFRVFKITRVNSN